MLAENLSLCIHNRNVEIDRKTFAYFWGCFLEFFAQWRKEYTIY